MPLHYAVLTTVSGRYSPPEGKLLTCYSPVRHSTRFPKEPFAFDLHVWGTPPALILSQNQTLVVICSGTLSLNWLFSDNDSLQSFIFARNPIGSALITLKVHWRTRFYLVFKDQFFKLELTDEFSSSQAKLDINNRVPTCQAIWLDVSDFLSVASMKKIFTVAIRLS